MSYIGNQPISTAFQVDTFSGNGSTVAFTMSVAPANTSSILVAVTGVVQDPSTYSVSGTTLTFSAAPPSGTSNISVRYLGIPASGVTTTAYRTVTNFTATAGQTTFSTPSYTVGYIDVYRNGVRLAAADYTATTGTTVVLASAASAGDSVVTESFYVSSVLNAIPATNNSVQQTYLASGVAGTGPIFTAYGSSGAFQSIPNNTATKVAFSNILTDTNSNFSTSNYRFTPSVAGYYLFTGYIAWYPAGGLCSANFYKNGSSYLSGSSWVANTANGLGQATTGIIQMNGTTDYVEIWVTQTSGSALNLYGNGSNGSVFQGCLLRAA